MDVRRGMEVRSLRFEAWYAEHIDINPAEVADMWNGSTYVSYSYCVEVAWAAWCEAINGVVRS